MLIVGLGYAQNVGRKGNLVITTVVEKPANGVIINYLREKDETS